MYFRTYGLRKTWLYKCLKSPFSEDPLRSNKVNGQKHCSKGNERPITILPCEGNSSLKSLSELYTKS